MTQGEREAKQFERIRFARDNHNTTCPLGPAIEVHMNPFDIKRMMWEEGDVIATLLLVGNDRVQPDRLRILCAGDKEAQLPEHSTAVQLPVELPPDFVVPEFMPELEPALAEGDTC